MRSDCWPIGGSRPALRICREFTAGSDRSLLERLRFSGIGVAEQDDVPLRDMDRERSDSVPTFELRLCLANASIQHGNHALSLHAFGLPTTIAGRREWRW